MPTTLFGQVQLSCIPVRAAAQHSSELVSQLLYLETYEILERRAEWSYIRSSHDQYEGWIANNQVHVITKEQFERPFESYQTSAAYWDAARSAFCYLGSPSYNYTPAAEAVFPDHVCWAALSLENSPYLWGGRTCAGIDCSGLVQVAFRMGGISLPRDASQQALLGKKITWGQHQRGDLAFFENDKQKITHVGLVLGTKKIIHASAWVRVDILDERGIWHQQELTHHLAFLKRLH